MVQIIDNFEHKSKQPNFVRDQFKTLLDMKSVSDNCIDEGHISYCIQTGKHYIFNSSNDFNVSTGKWREFKGQAGQPGQDGRPGQDGVSTYTAFVFKSSTEKPNTPQGGSWNYVLNILTPPTGWSTNDHLDPPVWMSNAVFNSYNTTTPTWSEPVRITGENGKDGEDGTKSEYIYKLSNSRPSANDTPNSVNIDDYVPTGWTDNPTGISEAMPYEWVSIRNKNDDDTWSDYSIPVIWSRWGANGKDGDGVEYVYKRTLTNEAPESINGTSQEEEWIPEGWTDDPTGVDEVYRYEWVCVRKYRNEQWGEYSIPALWAKYGADGRDGSDGTSLSIKGTLDSTTQLPVVGQPGEAWVVGQDLYVWDGFVWKNLGPMKGPAGDTAYLHIAYADGVVYNTDNTIKEVIGFTTSDSATKSWLGTYSDHTFADSDNPKDYRWQKTKGPSGDRGPQGVPGPEGPGGETLYTWIAYADTASGGGISNNPTGKEYIGLAFNRDTPTESYSDPSIYKWSLIKGADGAPGADGEDGKTFYTWIKYSDVNPTLPGNEDAVIQDIPNDETTKYIGIAVNKENREAEDPNSTNWRYYTWSRFKGNDGVGVTGRIPYPAGIYDATITYICTDTKAPYVIYDGKYYIMVKNQEWLGTDKGRNPKEDYERFGDEAIWQPMDSYQAIYTELMIADNGKLGKFIFNGDYMFSQEGTNVLGEPSSDYQYFLEPGPRFSFKDVTKWYFQDNNNNYGETIIEDTKITFRNNSNEEYVVYLGTIPTTTPVKGFELVIANEDGSSNLSDGNYLNWQYYDSGGYYSQSLNIGKNKLNNSDKQGRLVASFAGRTPISVTLTLVNDNYFTPNFQVNAVTGEVKMQKGITKLQNVPTIEEINTSTGRHKEYTIDGKNVILNVVDDAENVDDNTLKIFPGTSEPGTEVTIYYSCNQSRASHNLEVFTSTSKTIYNGQQTFEDGFNVGMMYYKGVNVTHIYLRQGTAVTLRYMPTVYGKMKVTTGSTTAIVPYPQYYSWEVVNGNFTFNKSTIQNRDTTAFGVLTSEKIA